VGSRGYVRCIEVGNGEVDSITRPMEWQLAELARKIQADPELRRGFHMIGHSQGTLLSRAFVQRYDWPQVHSLISWVGPQAGQFGVPTYEPLLGYLNRVTSGMWYAPQLQSARPSSRTLSFANYWRDPTKLEVYRANSGFLADINNERPLKNASYAARLGRLKAFLLVYSSSDSIIQPAVSSWFGFDPDGSLGKLEPLASRRMYKEDWIGLRALDADGRLHFAQVDCMHIEVPSGKCKKQIWDQTTRPFIAPQRRAEDLVPWIRQNAPGFHFTSASLPREAYRYINSEGPVTEVAPPAERPTTSGRRGGGRGRGREGRGRGPYERGGRGGRGVGRPSPTEYEELTPEELAQLHSELEEELSDVEAAEAAAARRSRNAERARRRAEEAAKKRAEGTAAARARAAAARAEAAMAAAGARAEAAMLEAEARAAEKAKDLMEKSERMARQRLEEARERVDELRRALQRDQADASRPPPKGSSKRGSSASAKAGSADGSTSSHPGADGARTQRQGIASEKDPLSDPPTQSHESQPEPQAAAQTPPAPRARRDDQPSTPWSSQGRERRRGPENKKHEKEKQHEAKKKKEKKSDGRGASEKIKDVRGHAAVLSV
jgi:palmitoyl-protein thioesterase